MTTDALKYHEQGKPGKVSVIPSKPCTTAAELSLAYTPGVAEPSLAIAKEPQKAYAYTNKSNLVGIISNGTAVLGLGNIGALAGKPVMEGKAVLFKRFADIDGFDLELGEKDPAKVAEIISSLEPTFGGINLEDIKAPDCFYIEEELVRRLSIPVFHDDQHGTAIIVAAGLHNALELVGKKIEEAHIVFSGAGAAAIACAKMLLELGAQSRNILMCDSEGVITIQRSARLNRYKQQFARDTNKKTLAEAMAGADVFIGVSVANLVTPAMLKSMNSRPIVFALANPVPEIGYAEAKKAVPGAIVATGRSDFPNQVNNVLGFPFIFRGALDVQAKAITLGMKKAAIKALAELAHLRIPREVVKAYGRDFTFGSEYIIPKPFDPRVLYYVAPAVAEAAMNEGIARKKIDPESYKTSLRVLAKSLAKGKFT